MLPNAFLDRLKSQMEDEFDQFVSIYESPPCLGLRVNTLKLTPGEFVSLSQYPLT